MRTCEFCRSEIPDNASFCGICGREVRSLPQSMRGNGNSPVAGQTISSPGNSARVADSPKRSIRKPYHYAPQPYQDQRQDDVPTVAYSPKASVGAPTQHVPYSNPPTSVNQGAQRYPSVQPQLPLYVGNSQPPTRGQVNPTHPKRKGKGCLISAAVVLFVLFILGAIAIPTTQKVLAFGSTISTQSPLSTQTGFMTTSDRVNILIMGYGGSGHDGAYLTDSIVVMSLMPQSHHTTLISVPRDLWVQNPANSGNYTKINAVYPVASNNNADPVVGGDADAQKVSLITGLDIKYWMTINFTGFRDFINAIGGVDVKVPDSFKANYPANDDPTINPNWKVVRFTKGMQHMDGETAIEYARARYVIDNAAEGTDFARSARQQLIMKAALAKLKDWHTWPSFFSALDALKHTIYTNLSLADLATFALKMDLNNAHRIGLSFSNVLMDSKSPDGQDILLPQNRDWNLIKTYINQQLYN